MQYIVGYIVQLFVLLRVICTTLSWSLMPLSFRYKEQNTSKKYRQESNYDRIDVRQFLPLFVETKDDTDAIQSNLHFRKDKTNDWHKNLVVQNDSDYLYEGDSVEDWIPDSKKSRRYDGDLIPAKDVLGNKKNDDPDQKKSLRAPSSPYLDEEEEVITAMGGNTKMSDKVSRREIGFIGDSTLREISADYSVPICYLADVLVQWGVDVPINIHDRLGDLVVGDQAFALVEAVNTLDVGYLNDRYSNQSLAQVCDEWEIDLKDGLEFAIKEGWSLPFGVRTSLRVEQEDELLRVYSALYRDVDE